MLNLSSKRDFFNCISCLVPTTLLEDYALHVYLLIYNTLHSKKSAIQLKNHACSLVFCFCLFHSWLYKIYLYKTPIKTQLKWKNFWGLKKINSKAWMRGENYFYNTNKMVWLGSYLAVIDYGVLPIRICWCCCGWPEWPILGHFLLSKSFWILSASSIIKKLQKSTLNSSN